MSEKSTKIFKIIIIILVIFLIAEVIYFGIRYYINRQDSIFYTVINDVVVEKDGYVGVGFSDYRNSDFNNYSNGYNKATIFGYENNEIIKEKGINVGYSSYYNDVVKVSDGYIAVGNIEMTKEQKEERLSEGLIVKYDSDFNILWRKNISILNKTELYKIKVDTNDNLIVVGSSIYGEGYVGNHNTGGAILFKLDKNGEEIFRANLGGPYSGRFNDVLIEKDGYVVVGLGKSNSGMIVKYNLKGKKVWSSSYGYTDKTGFNAIDKLENKYVVATSKVVNPKDLSNYQAAIVVFDNKGNKVDDTKFSSSNITCFTDILVNKDKVIVSGYTGKLNNKVLESDALVVEYDNNLFEVNNKLLKGNKNDFYTDVYLNNKNVILLGYSNSKIKGYNLNGYDYLPIVTKY